MNIYKEAVIPNEDVNKFIQLIGEVVHFNKCHYFVSGVDFDPCKGYPFTKVRVHFKPHEFNVTQEPLELPIQLIEDKA